MKKRVRIVNKTRFICFLLALSFVTYLIAGAIFDFEKAYGSSVVKYKYVYINSGDTLWEIAKGVEESRDVRKEVNRIMELNNMKSAYIKSGDVIKVPVY